MSALDLVYLYEDDLCAIITVDGEFAGIWAHDDQVYKVADIIQQWMSVIMKEQDNRRGVWLWRVSKDQQYIFAEFLKESPRDEYPSKL